MITTLDYHCPGEETGIPASVHYARLSAGLACCQECPHRHQHGLLTIPATTLATAKTSATTTNNHSSQHSHSGLLLSHHDPQSWKKLIDQIAAWYWKQEPFAPIARYEWSETIVSTPRQPRIVIGFDGIPETLTAIKFFSDNLSKAGIELVDLGHTLGTLLDFSISYLEGSGGIMLSHARGNHSQLIVDCQNQHGSPLPELLHQAELNPTSSQLSAPHITFQKPNSLREFNPVGAYESSITRRIHGLRPLKIVIHIANDLGRVLLENITNELPCDTIFIDHQAVNNPQIQAVQFVKTIRDERADIGFAFSDDLRRVSLYNELGRPLSTEQIFKIVSHQVLREHPDQTYLLATKFPALGEHLQIHGGIVQANHELAKFAVEMQQYDSRLGIDSSGTIWHGDPQPRRDGVLTMIHALKALSLNDTPVSQVVATLDHLRGQVRA
jgi:phosphomannomutase